MQTTPKKEINYKVLGARTHSWGWIEGPGIQVPSRRPLLAVPFNPLCLGGREDAVGPAEAAQGGLGLQEVLPRDEELETCQNPKSAGRFLLEL